MTERQRSPPSSRKLVRPARESAGSQDRVHIAPLPLPSSVTWDKARSLPQASESSSAASSERVSPTHRHHGAVTRAHLALTKSLGWLCHRHPISQMSRRGAGIHAHVVCPESASRLLSETGARSLLPGRAVRGQRHHADKTNSLLPFEAGQGELGLLVCPWLPEPSWDPVRC